MPTPRSSHRSGGAAVVLVPVRSGRSGTPAFAASPDLRKSCFVDVDIAWLLEMLPAKLLSTDRPIASMRRRNGGSVASLDRPSRSSESKRGSRRMPRGPIAGSSLYGCAK